MEDESDIGTTLRRLLPYKDIKVTETSVAAAAARNVAEDDKDDGAIIETSVAAAAARNVAEDDKDDGAIIIEVGCSKFYNCFFNQPINGKHNNIVQYRRVHISCALRAKLFSCSLRYSTRM